ncbi:hypothetical protein F4859DRAFT_136461 [Xylaria cf. heliscus]|nr:hypothetical protein F4859DRAFT_136461 [Xylaria cf. heliscus]
MHARPKGASDTQVREGCQLCAAHCLHVRCMYGMYGMGRIMGRMDGMYLKSTWPGWIWLERGGVRGGSGCSLLYHGCTAARSRPLLTSSVCQSVTSHQSPVTIHHSFTSHCRLHTSNTVTSPVSSLQPKLGRASRCGAHTLSLSRLCVSQCIYPSVSTYIPQTRPHTRSIQAAVVLPPSFPIFSVFLLYCICLSAYPSVCLPVSQSYLSRLIVFSSLLFSKRTPRLPRLHRPIPYYARHRCSLLHLFPEPRLTLNAQCSMLSTGPQP